MFNVIMQLFFLVRVTRCFGFSLLVAEVKISNLFDNASFVLNAVTFMTFANSNLVTYVSLTSICKPIFFKIPGVH